MQQVLGVTVSSDLTWNAIVNTIVRKGEVAVMYQLKRLPQGAHRGEH